MRRHQPRILHADAAVRKKELAAKVVDLETAPLAGREPTDLRADGPSVDGETVDHGIDVADIQIRKIDSVDRIAVLQLFEPEFQILDGERRDREAEIALLFLLLFAQTRHDLLDIHHAVGHLPQIELRVGQPAVAQRKSVAEDSELRDEGMQLAHIQQRVAAVVLDIEPREFDTIEQPDIHPVDAYDRLESARGELRGLAHDEVLHRIDTQKQGQHEREHDQQQNRRR